MSAGLREHLLAIGEKRGRLTPHIVLEEARDPEHPLHSRFEWDDGKAAESYRLDQARHLFRVCRLAYVTPKGPATIRAFHSMRDEIGPVYESTDTIAEDPLLTKLLLQSMERDWRALKAKYGRFDEFWRMVRDNEPVAV